MQAAFTQPDATPGYINASDLEGDMVRVTLREKGDGDRTGRIAFLDLPRISLLELAEEIRRQFTRSSGA